MVKITSELASGKVKNIRFFLNYPKIDEKENFAKYVNSLILNDVNIFQEIVEFGFENADKYAFVNALSEFQVAFNKNGLISIPVEFSQIMGFTDISHICSYNYDLEREEKITLNTIFKEGCDYNKILKNYIMDDIYNILENYRISSIYDLVEETIHICENPTFYFNERSLVICISSFEMTSSICNLIEFEIDFRKIKGILSEYAIDKIFN